MKRPLRVRIRLWVLMSVSFSMIMMLTVAAVIHTFIGHMGDEYRKEMSRMLSNGLAQLEASDFSESTLKTLSKQGVSILLMDAGTGELRFRSGGLLPMAEDVQLDVSALKHSERAMRSISISTPWSRIGWATATAALWPRTST